MPPVKTLGAKPRKAQLATPRQEDQYEEDAPMEDDLQDAEEAALAASLLAEVMIGTPRANAHHDALRTPRGAAALYNPLGSVKKELLPTPLPSTIQPPSIVLQHSIHQPAQLSPEQQLIPRYDYLTPAEMEATLAEQQRQQQQAAQQQQNGPQAGQAVCAPAAMDEPSEEEGWYVDRLLARRRLKGDGGSQPGTWQYLVRWIGRGEEDDMWVPETDLDPAFIEADLAEAATERAMLSARGAAPPAAPPAAPVAAA